MSGTKKRAECNTGMDFAGYHLGERYPRGLPAQVRAVLHSRCLHRFGVKVKENCHKAMSEPEPSKFYILCLCLIQNNANEMLPQLDPSS